MPVSHRFARANSMFTLAALALALFLLGLSGPLQGQAQREPQFTDEGSEACLACHSGERMHAVSEGPHGPEHPDSPMSQQGCESCHGPGSFHVSRAFGGAGFPDMINFGDRKDAAPRDVQVQVCLDCHAAEHGLESGLESPIAFIGSPHDTDDISCASCHAGHVAKDLVVHDREAQAENCYGCHEATRTEHPRFESASIDIDRLDCGTCHDVHAVAID